MGSVDDFVKERISGMQREHVKRGKPKYTQAELDEFKEHQTASYNRLVEQAKDKATKKLALEKQEEARLAKAAKETVKPEL